MNRLIGRHKEQAKLQTCMNSERSGFVVVYQGLLHLILLYLKFAANPFARTDLIVTRA